jgi:hypothetical protein
METNVEPVKQARTSRLMGLPLTCRHRTPKLPNYHESFVVTRWNCSGRTFLSLVLIWVIVLPSALVAAQETGATRPAAQTHPTHRRPSVDDRVKKLAKNLDLDEAQQSAVKNILEQRRQESLRLRLDPSIAPNSRIARFRVLQDKTVERIRAVLNEEQRKKYDPLVVRGISPAPDQRSVEDWLKVSDDPTGSANFHKDQKP